MMGLSRALNIHSDENISDSTESLGSDLSDENICRTTDGRNIKYKIKGNILNKNGKRI
jgi:hypothetical protein